MSEVSTPTPTPAPTPVPDSGGGPDPASQAPSAPGNNVPSTDDQEWDKATDDFAKRAGLETGKEDEGKPDSPDKEDESGKKSGEGEEQDEPDKSVEEDDDENADQEEPSEEVDTEPSPEASARQARMASRQAAEQKDAVKTDVREKMFAETPKELSDAEGNPIRNVEDVMDLVDPKTGESYFQNESEARAWLMSAKQEFQQKLDEQEKQIEQIAEVNIDLKDQADTISDTYGELLKAMPELRDELWQRYEKTLVKDEKTDIITKAPVSLQEFYITALQPYADLAEHFEAQADDGSVPQSESAPGDNKPPVKTEAEKAEEKRRDLADRSDIYGGGGDSTPEDKDSKEWQSAHEYVFGKV